MRNVYIYIYEGRLKFWIVLGTDVFCNLNFCKSINYVESKVFLVKAK